MANRPKQRNIVRWNDDLDKSLLLFITHTCTEMGIKIPYEEVARRMGSTFSEGAIVQHIAKLRNGMAQLNVAPVPAPPKRGTVTTRPSSYYQQKARSSGPLPPPPPPPTLPVSRSRARSGARQMTVTKTRTAKRKASRRIKRSDSDQGDTDDEFGGGSNDEFQAQSNLRKRRRGGVTQIRNSSELVDSTRDYYTNYGIQNSIEGSSGPTSGLEGGYDYFAAMQNAAFEHEEPEIEATTPKSQSPSLLGRGLLSHHGQQPVNCMPNQDMSQFSFTHVSTHLGQQPDVYNDIRATGGEGWPTFTQNSGWDIDHYDPSMTHANFAPQAHTTPALPSMPEAVKHVSPRLIGSDAASRNDSFASVSTFVGNTISLPQSAVQSHFPSEVFVGLDRPDHINTTDLEHINLLPFDVNLSRVTEVDEADSREEGESHELHFADFNFVDSISI